jgi:hypothetical protein
MNMFTSLNKTEFAQLVGYLTVVTLLMRIF